MNFSTKASLVAAAVASVLGTSAYALNPTQTAAIPATQTFFAGGGSAQVNAALVAVSSLLNSVDYYTDSTTGGNSASFLILSGTLKASLGTLGAGTPILFEYRFTGGSFPNGGLPQIGSGATLAYPTQASLGLATATTNSFPLPTYAYAANTGATGTPDFGLTDTELALFNYTDNLNGTPQQSSTAISAVQQDGIYNDVEGVAVTNALYAVKSNFSKAEVEGILAGSITDWSQLFGDNGQPLSDPSGQSGVFLLDRGSGSGTKAAGNQYFLDYPGGKTSADTGAQDPGSFTNGYSGAGTGGALLLTGGYQDVKEGSSGAIVTDLQNANAAGKYAIAILATEFPPALNQVGGVNQYSFAKINGIGIDTGYDSTATPSPITGQYHDNINDPNGKDSSSHNYGTSYTNVVNGTYDFFYQNSFNTKKGFLSGTSNNALWATSIKVVLNKATIASVNSGNAFPSSVPGLVLDPIIVGSQAKGTTLYSRSKVSTAPLQPIYDATNGAITYGFDPL